MKNYMVGILGVLFLVVPNVEAGMDYKKIGEGFIGSGVGYSDFEIGNNKFKVSYTGAVNNTADEVMKYTYQRAKELCAEKGFTSYDISNTAMNQKASSSATQSFGYTQYTDTTSQVIYSLDVDCKK